MNTTNPEKLKGVVQLLAEKKSEIDSYFEAYIFKPYNIDIEKCLIEQSYDDAKRLLDFSFTTRQGGQNKKSLQSYEDNEDEVRNKLKTALAALVYDEWDAKQGYESALALINSIEGIGQKIASMFLKFLVYYSDDFKGKKELERELFIPIDAHVARLLFTKFNGEIPDRLSLYEESINQAYLKYELQQTNPVKLSENKTKRLQEQIRQDFEELEIREPPIILDYLWYVGYMYCSRRFGSIGCSTCFLNQQCETGYNFS